MISPKSSHPDRPIFVQPGATDMRKQINTSGGDTGCPRKKSPFIEDQIAPQETDLFDDSVDG